MGDGDGDGDGDSGSSNAWGTAVVVGSDEAAALGPLPKQVDGSPAHMTVKAAPEQPKQPQAEPTAAQP